MTTCSAKAALHDIIAEREIIGRARARIAETRAQLQIDQRAMGEAYARLAKSQERLSQLECTLAKLALI